MFLLVEEKRGALLAWSLTVSAFGDGTEEKYRCSGKYLHNKCFKIEIIFSVSSFLVRQKEKKMRV